MDQFMQFDNSYGDGYYSNDSDVNTIVGDDSMYGFDDHDLMIHDDSPYAQNHDILITSDDSVTSDSMVNPDHVIYTSDASVMAIIRHLQYLMSLQDPLINANEYMCQPFNMDI